MCAACFCNPAPGAPPSRATTISSRVNGAIRVDTKRRADAVSVQDNKGIRGRNRAERQTEGRRGREEDEKERVRERENEKKRAWEQGNERRRMR